MSSDDRCDAVAYAGFIEFLSARPGGMMALAGGYSVPTRIADQVVELVSPKFVDYNVVILPHCEVTSMIKVTPKPRQEM